MIGALPCAEASNRLVSVGTTNSSGVTSGNATPVVGVIAVNEYSWRWSSRGSRNNCTSALPVFVTFTDAVFEPPAGIRARQLSGTPLTLIGNGDSDTLPENGSETALPP